MNPGHHPHTMFAGSVELVIAAAAVLAVAAYFAATVKLHRRGDAWPVARVVSFTTGGTVLTAALLFPLPGGPFTAHMAQHLVVAMIAPLLLVLARPLTLALRALPPGKVRRALLAVAHSRPATWLVFPPLAALLDIGGLWLLYRTSLLSTTQHQPLAYAAVHAHVLLAGLLFTFAVCQLDPLRHRHNLAWRGLTLLAAGAGHAILAKTLYATPPPGTSYTTADLHAGAQLMYFGGDLTEICLAAVLAVQWYAATRRAQRTSMTAPAGSVPEVLGGEPAAATSTVPIGQSRNRPPRVRSTADHPSRPALPR